MMRTARALTVGGPTLTRHPLPPLLTRHPLPPVEQTDACENITFARFSKR